MNYLWLWSQCIGAASAVLGSLILIFGMIDMLLRISKRW